MQQVNKKYRIFIFFCFKILAELTRVEKELQEKAQAQVLGKQQRKLEDEPDEFNEPQSCKKLIILRHLSK